jgi:hypothetical protein
MFWLLPPLPCTLSHQQVVSIFQGRGQIIRRESLALYNNKLLSDILHFILSLNWVNTMLEFLNNLWGLGSEKDYSYRTCAPGYIGWGAQDMQVVFAKRAAILDHTFFY